MNDHHSDNTTDGRQGEGARLERWLVACLILLGSGLRLWIWFGQRSLWIDEATVALGVLTRPFGPGFGSQDFGQMSPPVWLAAVRISVAAFGASEMALRLPTLLLAIGYLPVIWWLGRRLLGAPAGYLALAWSAVSPALVHRAAELKPYGGDPLAAAVVLGLCWYAGQAARISRGRGVAIGAALAGLCWISNPAIIVLIGALPTAWFGTRWWARPRDWPARVALVGVTAAGFLVVYIGYLRPEPWIAEYLETFWAGHYLEWYLPSFGSRLRQAVVEVVSPVSFDGTGGLGLVLAGLGGYGAWSMVRASNAGAVRLLVGPLVVLVALALAHLYPIALRLDLFAAPIVTLLVVAAITSLFRARLRPVVMVGAAAALLMPLRASIRAGLDPIDGWPHARPVVATAKSEYRPGEVVYVFARAAPEWLYYTTDWANPDRARIAMIEAEYRYPSGRTFANGLPRNGPVEASGTPLRAHHRGMTEVFGLYSGYFPSGRVNQLGVDPGWAQIEVERMTAGGPRCIWLAILHGSSPERQAIRSGLEQRGYHAWVERVASSSRVERGCLVENSPVAR